MRSNKKRKFQALFEIYNNLKEQFPYSALNHLELCGVIVEMPAPEWYIEHQLASRIINEQISIRNQKMADIYGR